MKIPFNYPLCARTECPKAKECLRHVALTECEDAQVTIFNPKFLETSENGCKHYTSTQKVRYAKGMKKVMGELPYKIHERAVTALSLHFSERSYYRIRKGERPLSPDEQKAVRQIIARLGFSEEWDFDAYEEDYLWQ